MIEAVDSVSAPAHRVRPAVRIAFMPLFSCDFIVAPEADNMSALSALHEVAA
jgi:hypothetical protein